jgi:23S rRNA A1618 N6-methylase RlmF
LSKALLHKEFGLDVLIPENALIPTIPLRLNYILWLEDVLKDVWKYQGKKPEEVGSIRGIDVGKYLVDILSFLSQE